MKRPLGFRTRHTCLFNVWAPQLIPALLQHPIRRVDDDEVDALVWQQFQHLDTISTMQRISTTLALGFGVIQKRLKGVREGFHS